MRLALFAVFTCALSATAATAQQRTLGLNWTVGITEPAELLAISRDPAGEHLTTLREPLSPGHQDTSLSLPPLPRQATTVQAGIVAQGRVIAQSPIIALAGQEVNMDLTLRATLSLGFQEIWECGEDGLLHLDRTTDLGIRRGGEQITFRPSADDPAQFEANGESAITFAGNVAQVIWQGTALAPCAPSLFPPLLPFSAFAHDGSWTIQAGPDEALLDIPTFEDETLAAQGLRFEAAEDGSLRMHSNRVELRLTDRQCLMPDIDMPYPVTAQLTLRETGSTSAGCAGSPLDLLEFGLWRVHTIFGAPVVAGLDTTPNMTLQFGEGQVSGRSVCNRYFGSLAVEGGALRMRDLGTTRISCPIGGQHLELRFLDALEAATGFDLGPDGMLTLRAGATPILSAQRQSRGL